MGRNVFEYHAEKMRDDPDYKVAYDSLEQEFSIAHALIEARAAAGMTQADVANRLGISQPVIARMESGKNISVKSLQRYARAVGRPIPILIQPEKTHPDA